MVVHVDCGRRVVGDGHVKGTVSVEEVGLTAVLEVAAAAAPTPAHSPTSPSRSWFRRQLCPQLIMSTLQHSLMRGGGAWGRFPSPALPPPPPSPPYICCTIACIAGSHVSLCSPVPCPNMTVTSLPSSVPLGCSGSGGAIRLTTLHNCGCPSALSFSALSLASSGELGGKYELGGFRWMYS